MVIRVVGFVLILALAPPGWAKQLLIPVNVHIVQNMDMQKGDVTMTSWVKSAHIREVVIPEVNRIWGRANIRFVLNNVSKTKALSPPNKDMLLDYVVNAKRDMKGKSDPKRIKKLNRLIDYSAENKQEINVYLVPYIGEKSQGNAKRKAKRVLLGMWTDKYAKGSPPRKVKLLEQKPFKHGSLARTFAHELGHILGLVHPNKRDQTIKGRLMGGRRPGYILTKPEINIARDNAKLAF